MPGTVGTATPEIPTAEPATTAKSPAAELKAPDVAGAEVRDPMWQNEVPTDLRKRNIPKATNTLERENNYSKINSLC